jgi:hypothetical protein
MSEKTKQILDKLCQDKMSITEAIKELDMSKEKIWKLLDDYEYEPTVEESLEAFLVLKEVRRSQNRKSLSVSKGSRNGFLRASGEGSLSSIQASFGKPTTQTLVISPSSASAHYKENVNARISLASGIFHRESVSSATGEYSKFSDTINPEASLRALAFGSHAP